MKSAREMLECFVRRSVLAPKTHALANPTAAWCNGEPQHSASPHAILDLSPFPSASHNRPMPIIKIVAFLCLLQCFHVNSMRGKGANVSHSKLALPSQSLQQSLTEQCTSPLTWLKSQQRKLWVAPEKVQLMMNPASLALIRMTKRLYQSQEETMAQRQGKKERAVTSQRETGCWVW